MAPARFRAGPAVAPGLPDPSHPDRPARLSRRPAPGGLAAIEVSPRTVAISRPIAGRGSWGLGSGLGRFGRPIGGEGIPTNGSEGQGAPRGNASPLQRGWSVFAPGDGRKMSPPLRIA